MKVFAITTILMLGTTILAAPALTLQSTKSSNKTVVFEPNTPTQRPNIQGRFFIENEFQNGTLEIDVPSGISYIEITIYNSVGMVVEETIVTPDNPSVELPLSYGEYHIICITDENQIYSGTLNL